MNEINYLESLLTVSLRFISLCMCMNERKSDNLMYSCMHEKTSAASTLPFEIAAA